jgi:hypothetical protein
VPDRLRPANALAATAYAGSNHAATLVRAMRMLREIHGPRSDDDQRCKDCRDSRGGPRPWPCRTFTEIAEAFRRKALTGR